jgi:chemotaxis regulatin CheY-phosphate phosphatase CheZ
VSKPRSVPDALLLDSFASLRIADRLVREFADASDEPAESTAGALLTLHRVLIASYREIAAILASLRQSRSILEQTAMERIQHSQEKLIEVSSATETAATDMLDGLDRSLHMVGQLDSIQSDDVAKEIHATLRDELFRVMTCLQFQDITSQQLTYASSVLGDIEGRMSALVNAFEGMPGFSEEMAQLVEEAPAGPVVFDPFATTNNAIQRQAVADEVFITNGHKPVD